MTINATNAIIPFMAKWIRKVKHDPTSFRISIPKVVVERLGWQDCDYVIVEDHWGDKLLIRRLPGDEKRGNEGSKYPVVGD
ncbi:MAG: hypothetical protein Q8M94_06200 [Ignavibacteria bacterium]|nr:hypothetical protein [Ignavibacteria bacterium]